MTDVEVRVDKRTMTLLVRALNREADGRELKADLVARFKLAAEPAEAATQAAILAMKSEGYAHESIRGAVAANVETDVVLGGRRAGVAVKARRVRTRGFWHAPKRLNRPEGWDHPVYYREGRRRVEVHQTGLPGWFDTTLRLQRPAFRRAAAAAMDEIAARIDRRTKG